MENVLTILNDSKNEIIKKAVVVKRNEPVISSQVVAKIFDKEHYNILRDIEKIIENFNALNFESVKIEEYFKETATKDKKGEFRKSYEMTEKGFNLLVMGFTGEKALKYKVYLVNQFDNMKKFIKEITELALDYKPLTDAVYEYNKQLGKEDKEYHYTNEANMLNRIVLGMSSKKYKELFRIESNDPIRKYFSESERKLMKELQKYDAILLNMGVEYEERKEKLMQYKNKLLPSLPQ